MYTLEEKLKFKIATLGVIGLGYVGLPLAVEKAKAGYKVIGFDIQEKKVNMVNDGINYIGDIVDNELKLMVEKGKFFATTSFENVATADCICICVPTPLDKHQQPDISYVEDSVKNILKYLHKDMLVILESTTYPGTTEEFIKPILESTGLKCGKDFYLAFSPERVDPGNLLYKTKNTPKVVGGITEKCTNLAATMYENILEAPIHKVSSPAVAEMEKILENTYRNVNIGLVNELAILCNEMKLSFWEVIEAAKTKPYGFQAFYPGPGLGGHCIPLDPYYLSWKAREYGFHTSMIESSMMINDRMPNYCVERIGKILNQYKKAISNSTILIIGIAYKQDIDDYRESPAIKIMNTLINMKSKVKYYDPYIAEFNAIGLNMKSEKSLNKELLELFDLVVITAAHTNVDYRLICKYSRFIFDTKNILKNIQERTNIELL